MTDHPMKAFVLGAPANQGFARLGGLDMPSRKFLTAMGDDGAVPDRFTITPTGRSVALTEVSINLDDPTRVMYGQVDVTPYLTFEQMKTVEGFDPNAYLNKLYVAHYQATNGGKSPPPVGSTSVLYNWYQNLQNELSGGSGTQVSKIANFALTIGGLFVAWQVLKMINEK